MLLKFICVLFTAVLLGIMAGNYVAAKGMYITLTPPAYMQKFIYISPLLMIVAVVVLCIYISKVKNDTEHSKTPRYIAVFVFTVIGIMVSGFCGMYTIKYFVYVTAGVIVGLAVVLILAFMQFHNGRNIFKIHNVKTVGSMGEFAAFCVYAIVVVLSAVMPIGPLPVILAGVIWFVLIAKAKN